MALLEAFKMSICPPIDIERVAAHLGVSDILETDLLEDGRLERIGQRTIIYVRSSTGTERRRFTVAHELGHLVLAEPGKNLVARRLLRDEEERFCDRFAASLLLPRGWVINRYGGKPETLETLRNMGRVARVSLSAALIRLQETSKWTRSFLRWRLLDDGNWRYMAGVGLPIELSGHVRSAPGTGRILDSGSLRPGSSYCELPLLVRNHTTLAPAQLSVRGSSAVALVDTTGLKRESSSGSRFATD
jgi:hypothetical protein